MEKVPGTTTNHQSTNLNSRPRAQIATRGSEITRVGGSLSALRARGGQI